MVLITLDSRVFATTRRSPVSWVCMRWIRDVMFLGGSLERARKSSHYNGSSSGCFASKFTKSLGDYGEAVCLL